MSFLAILKDSLREALDTKVFYAMVILSLLVILFIATVGYRPVSVEDEARRLTDQMTFVISMQLRHVADKIGPLPQWHIKDFEQTNPGAQPWETGYRFALVLDLANEKDAKDVRRLQKDTVPKIEGALRGQLSYLKDLHVKEDSPRDEHEVRYLVTADGSRSSRSLDWPHEPVILGVLPIRFWHKPISYFVQWWEDTIINGFGAAVALLLSSIITAFFIPNMLRKGTVDLLLVKPLARTELLLSKYVGGLIFIFLNTVLIVVGVWFVLGLRTGLWGTGFLLTIFVLMFQFALYYAVSTLFAVLTRSPIVAILMACLTWFVFAFLIGYGYQTVDGTRKFKSVISAQAEATGQDVSSEMKDLPDRLLPDWAYRTADVIHFVTPHLKDLDVLTTKWCLEDIYPPDSPTRKVADKQYADFNWPEAFLVTGVYIAALLGLSCWWFATRDY